MSKDVKNSYHFMRRLDTNLRFFAFRNRVVPISYVLSLINLLHMWVVNLDLTNIHLKT